MPRFRLLTQFAFIAGLAIWLACFRWDSLWTGILTIQGVGVLLGMYLVRRESRLGAVLGGAMGAGISMAIATTALCWRRPDWHIFDTWIPSLVPVLLYSWGGLVQGTLIACIATSLEGFTRRRNADPSESAIAWRRLLIRLAAVSGVSMMMLIVVREMIHLD